MPSNGFNEDRKRKTPSLLKGDKVKCVTPTKRLLPRRTTFGSISSRILRKEPRVEEEARR